MVVSMLPDRYLCLMNCMSVDLEFKILIFGAYSAGLLFARSMSASTTSGFWASSLALCLERVSVPGVVFGEEVDSSRIGSSSPRDSIRHRCR